MLCKDDSKVGCESHNFLIIGGDDRLVELANIFSRKGYSVFTYGMDKVAACHAENLDDLDEAVSKCDIIIGPIPFSQELNKIYSLYSKESIEISDLFSKVTPEKKLFFGALNKSSRDLAQKHNIVYYDYHHDESYQVQNTIPTAEGALALMISETERTVYGRKVLILGYGRIGKLLSKYTKAIGANVYVEARKDSDMAWISANDMNAIHLNDLNEILGDMDIIVNTVPALILDSSRLQLLKHEVLILDLASLPGGVDFAAAQQKGLKTIHALGIPGKIAAKSSAEYIYNAVMKQLNR